MAMRMSARGAQKVASKARKLSNFGKCWSVGDKGVVLYPVYWDEEAQRTELLVGMIWGYRVNDMNALGLKASFIPSNAEINDDGMPVTPDITAQFSRLAPAFIAGEKEAKVKEMEAKAWPTAAAQKKALETIENEYDTTNNPDAKRAVIGRLSLLITTECIYIPIKDNKPDWDNAKLVAQSLSGARVNKLISIMEDPMYGVNKDSKFMEVQYTFTAQDGKKSTAGRNDPVGITNEYSLLTRFPEGKQKFEDLVSQLPIDSDIIRNHNYSYLHYPEQQLKSVYQAYSIINSSSLDTVPEDYEDSVAKSAQLIADLSIKNTLKNADLVQKIDEALAASQPIPVISEEKTESGEAPVMSSVPTVQDLMNSDSIVDGDLANVTL